MRAIILQGQSQYDVLRRFCYRYAKILKENGVEAIIYDLNLMNDTEEYLDLVRRFKPDFTLGFNPITIFYDDNKAHFEKTNIPHFVFLVDHPYYHLNRALEKPNHPLVHIIYLDKAFDETFAKLNINNASRKKVLSSEQVLDISYQSKIYDVVFFGSMVPAEEILEKIKINITDNLIKNYLLEFLSNIKNFLDTDKILLPNDIGTYFKSYVKNKLGDHFDTQEEIFNSLYIYLDQYYRYYTREQILIQFAKENLNMIVFGNDYSVRLLKNYENVIVKNPVSYQDCMNIVAQSKVTLNISPMFQSFHDRIPLAYMNKSVLCTNAMEDMIESMPECINNTIFYNLNNITEVSEIIKSLIENEHEYNSVVNDAYEMAGKYYSPQKDVEELLEIYQKKFS